MKNVTQAIGNLFRWLISLLGVTMDTIVTPVDPNAPPAPPGLRVFGVVIDAMIASNLTPPFIDKQLLWLKGAVNMLWPKIGPSIDALFSGGKLIGDPKGLVDAVFTALETIFGANPLWFTILHVTHGAVDVIWDAIAGNVNAKLAAKGLK